MRKTYFVMLMVVGVSAALAAASIATVVSGEGLKIRGTPVPQTSVGSWPVASGDELTTAASPAVVMVKDQSRITLAANSRVKLEGRKDHTCVFLLAGSIHLSAVAGAKMGLCGPGKALVVQAPFEGQVTLEPPNTLKVAPVQGTLAEGKSPCAGSPIFAAMGGKTGAVVIIGGAAAGAATGLALTRDQTPRSPSQ